MGGVFEYLQRLKKAMYLAGFLAKAKGELLSLSATFHALDVVSDPKFKDIMELESTFHISEDAVNRAWKYLLVLIKQRVWFENCPIVTKLTSQVMEWGTPSVSGDFEEDLVNDAAENVEAGVCKVRESVYERLRFLLLLVHRVLHI